MVASALLRGLAGSPGHRLWAALAVAVLARSPKTAAPAARPAPLPAARCSAISCRRLPSALYFSIQGPLTVWLATTFGAVRNIAEVGALGRLGLVVGIFSNLTGVVFLPRLARVSGEGLYRRRYLQFGGLLAAVALALLAAAAVAPRAFLFLLGPKYSGLERELLLMVAGAGLTLLGRLCRAREPGPVVEPAGRGWRWCS